MPPHTPTTQDPDRSLEPDRQMVTLDEAEALPILAEGEVVGGQRIAWGSNNTFLVLLDAGPGKALRAIYKPVAGEAPLYDFPSGTLYKRELAAYALSRALGWPDIPLTIGRGGPLGVGSMQLYVESDPNLSYFELIDGRTDTFQKFAVFDVIANNADRKGGHCLLDSHGRVWSIDHGLTFHSVFKLRTIMFEFWGQEVPEPLLRDLRDLKTKLASAADIAASLSTLLAEEEVEATLRRLDSLLESPVIPRLDPNRSIPWPLV